MPKKHANFWLDITLCLKYLFWLIEKCGLNSPRRLAVSYRCSDVNLYISFYDNGAQRNLKIAYNNKHPHNRDFFTFEQVSSRTTEQIYKRTHFTQAVKIVLFSCHFKRDYRRIHHDKISLMTEYLLQKTEKNAQN